MAVIERFAKVSRGESRRATQPLPAHSPKSRQDDRRETDHDGIDQQACVADHPILEEPVADEKQDLSVAPAAIPTTLQRYRRESRSHVTGLMSTPPRQFSPSQGIRRNRTAFANWVRPAPRYHVVVDEEINGPVRMMWKNTPLKKMIARAL